MFHGGILPDEQADADCVASAKQPAPPAPVLRLNNKTLTFLITAAMQCEHRHRAGARRRAGASRPFRPDRHAMTSTFDTAPDFDQPVAVLKHCHDRIRKQLKTMDAAGQPGRARRHARRGAPGGQRRAALFREGGAASSRRRGARPAADAARLPARKTPRCWPPDAGILDDHRQMEPLWQRLQPQLAAIASGQSSTLDSADAAALRRTLPAPTWTRRKATSRRWPSGCFRRNRCSSSATRCAPGAASRLPEGD